MNAIDLKVHDITCESCVKHVTSALQAVLGVTRVEVDLASGRTPVVGDLKPGGERLIASLASEDNQETITTGAVSSGSSKASACQDSLDNKVACCA